MEEGKKHDAKGKRKEAEKGRRGMATDADDDGGKKSIDLVIRYFL